MTITEVEAIPIGYNEPNDANSTRHILLVRLVADDGTVGWGEAVTMWPEATAATAAIVTGLAPLVVGTNVSDHTATWAEIKRHCWWYGEGGIATFALAAIDIALWDLAGKLTGASLVDMLGGPTHDALPALVSCHAFRADLDAMAAEMAGWVHGNLADGIKVAFGKRGDAALGLDLDRDTRFVASLRRELGPSPRIMIDLAATTTWTLDDAIGRAHAFEELDVDWIEEPLGANDPAGYSQLKAATSIRIAYGEREWTPAGIARILRTNTVDVVGVDPGRCEGITGFLQASEDAGAQGREINAHAWSGAIVTAASLALSIVTPWCRQLEFKPLPSSPQVELVTTPVGHAGGVFRGLTGPGLGIEIDLAALDRLRI
ncbi:mandelate racemase/muconate lactonizing enzyme family protein [Nocardioides sp.]|uniref:mandelate racemase/muconate lactonizing enzyme family protein n=1 Tax=Nocardioides sp. TaxID=35761 RepID=UPI0026114345|nr:mandelate racemase/muconate lactonizing enzyme family protein [Nocardioides sp.]MDI6911725.1 mandelate racemase/muconate lactonizing enzyme family protein [Nocardioides sp.]